MIYIYLSLYCYVNAFSDGITIIIIIIIALLFLVRAFFRRAVCMIFCLDVAYLNPCFLIYVLCPDPLENKLAHLKGLT